MSESRDVTWKDVWTGYLIALVGTAAFGGAVLVSMKPNMWRFAAASVLALVIAGFWVARGSDRWEGLSATLVTILYFVTVSIILILGMMYEFLPDPLPGLPRGDSTFYFVWPLAQLLGAVVGATLGRGRGAKTTEPV